MLHPLLSPSTHLITRNCLRQFLLMSLFLPGIVIMCPDVSAQTLTISNTGQTGTSGTNWSTSGTNPVTITATNTANINTSLISGYLSSGISVVVINTNVGIRISSDISKLSGAQASLTLKNKSFIRIDANVSISSSANALDIIMWADDDNSQGGTIDDFIFADAGSTFNSNGGKIIMAGGPDNGSNGGISGDGIPDGFAWNGSNSGTYGANSLGGLTLGPRTGLGPVVSILSKGGDIILRGATSNFNNYPGITSQANLKIESDAGKIIMYGKSGTGHGIELTFGAAPSVVISSSSSATPAISLLGTTTSPYSPYVGFWASNNALGNILIQSTSATGGGVTIEGTSTNGRGLRLGYLNTDIVSQVLSQSGNITLKGKGTLDASMELFGEVYLGNRKNSNPVLGVIPSVSASAANIVIQANDQYQFSNTAGKNTTFNSLGSLSIKAYTTGYTGTISWVGNVDFKPDFNAINLGETAGNYNLTLNSSLTAAGDITANVKDFTLSDGIGLFSTVAGVITIKAKNNFIRLGETRRTFSTVNGDINLYADSDADGTGQLEIGYITLNPGSGNISLWATTLMWQTVTDAQKPYINGTGPFYLRPSGASFQNVNTRWFFFDQDANGISGITIGKPTNTGDIIHETTALNVAGPILLYGSAITIDQNLTSTTGNDIGLYANTLSISGAAALSSTGNLLIEPTTSSTTIGLAGGAGSLAITAANFNTNFTDGFSEIRIGNVLAGDITLGSAITLKDNLSLSATGNFVLNEIMDVGNNNLKFSGNTIIPASNKFIRTNGVGKLIMDVNNSSSKLFPIGTGYYNPVTVTSHIAGNNEFYATVSPGVFYEGGFAGTPVSWTGKINVTWNIGNAAGNTGAGNVDMAFGWDAANVTGTLSSPRLVHFNGSIWEQTPGIPSFDLPSHTLTYSGYTGSFSPFGIAEANIVLPVRWISFTAKAVKDIVALNWITASEQNNAYFEIERSTDGSVFKTIGTIAADKQNPGSFCEYDYQDFSPGNGRMYYRLKQFDIDGHYGYSSIVSVWFGGNSDIKVLANPGSKQVSISLSNQLEGKIDAVIFDGSGRRLLLQQLIPGQNNIIQTGSLGATGIYFISVIHKGKLIYSGRFIQ